MECPDARREWNRWHKDDRGPEDSSGIGAPLEDVERMEKTCRNLDRRSCSPGPRIGAPQHCELVSNQPWTCFSPTATSSTRTQKSFRS